MRGLARSLFILEILVCFVPCFLYFLFGAIMLPDMLGRSFTSASVLQFELPAILSVVGGAIGVWTLLRFVSALLEKREIIERPGRILIGVLLGAAPLIYQIIFALFSENDVRWDVLIVLAVLPLLASAHILYLGRSMLMAGFQPVSRG